MTRADRLSYLAAEWEGVGRGESRRLAIHPSAANGTYEASGLAGAAEWMHGWSCVRFGETPGIVIDYGCGDGRLASPLADSCDRVIGCDVSQAMLDSVTDDRVGKVLIESLDTIDELPMVDGIHSSAVWIHLGHDLGAETLARLAARVKPGGLVGIDFPVYGGGGRDAGDWTDVAVWSPEEALVMIDAAGLEPVALHASSGSFSFAEVGENHHRYQWMVKP